MIFCMFGGIPKTKIINESLGVIEIEIMYKDTLSFSSYYYQFSWNNLSLYYVVG